MISDESIERYKNNAEYERTHGNLQGCLEFKQLAEWMKDYKRLLKQEFCEDAISREDVLLALTEEWTELTDETIHRFIKRIKSLPPVIPQPKTGHWIMTNDYHTCAYVSVYYAECSCCHEPSFERGNYCPNCGAKMTESEE